MYEISPLKLKEKYYFFFFWNYTW